MASAAEILTLAEPLRLTSFTLDPPGCSASRQGCGLFPVEATTSAIAVAEIVTVDSALGKMRYGGR